MLSLHHGLIGYEGKAYRLKYLKQNKKKHKDQIKESLPFIRYFVTVTKVQLTCWNHEGLEQTFKQQKPVVLFNVKTGALEYFRGPPKRCCYGAKPMRYPYYC